MLRILLRKLAQGVMLILIVSAITFALLSSAGGDSLTALRENPQISDETIENLRRIYGLDRPLVMRYGSWMSGAVRGELGDSFYFRTPVRDLILLRFLSTMTISLAALIVAISVAAVFGIALARYRWSWLAGLIEVIILIASSTPRIVLALIGLAFAVQFADTSAFWLASMVLAIPLTAVFLAQFRGSLSQAMKEDFVQLARAKGLSERVVIVRHAIRAALNPVLTVFGLALGGLLGGSVVVETVLGRQGLGSLMVTAVRSRDVPLIMGIVLLASAGVWLANTISELMQMLNDRRLWAAETK